MHIETDANLEFAGCIKNQMVTAGPMHSEADSDLAGGIRNLWCNAY